VEFHDTGCPDFSLVHATWVPCVVLWDERMGEMRRVERPEGFHEYRQTVEASRFLVGAPGR